MDETPADARGTAGDRGDRSEAPGRSQDAARDKGGSPADGSASTAIKFLQFNIDHARLASANLFETMRECSIEIALISDPYRPGKKLPKPPPGFQYVAAEIDPAAAMLVAKAPFDICPLLVTPTVVAVYCQARDHDVTLISVYAPPHKPMEPMLVLIEDAIRASRTRNIIVAGDFNAKHSAWGQQQTDARGSRLIAFAASHGLVVINDPDSIPTYENRYSMSWIDVTLASPSLLVRGHSWCVREDVTHSEHRYVVVTIGEPALTQRKRLTSYARAQMLQAVGRDPWFDRITRAEVRSAQALDLVLAQFYRVIDAHHRRHLRPVSRSRWGNPWWTPQLALERKRVNAARRRFQRCKDDALRAILRSRYSELLAAFRRATTQAREAYTRGFCDECSRKSVFSAPYNQAFGKVRVDQMLPPLVRPDGSRTTTHLESAALLLQTQVAVDDPATDGPDHRAVRAYVSAPYVTRDQDVPFTHAELSAVVRQMRDRSASGPDGLTSPVVKGLARVQGTFLLWFFNSAMRLGHFPPQWKRGRMIFIRKPGRSPDLTTSYRPICVTSVLGKIFERLLNGRLYHFLVRGGYIHPQQYGFTHGKSAVLALHRLHDQLVRLKRDRTPAVLMSLDFQGAFDSVWHPLVLQFFRDRALPSRLYHLLRTFLSGVSPPDPEAGFSNQDHDVSPDFSSDNTSDTIVAALDSVTRAGPGTDGVPSAALLSGRAVDAGLAALWSQMTAHQRRIEEILFEDRTKISNSQRALIITETNGMIKTCAEFQAAAALREGVVQELRRQLDEFRREAADLRIRVALGGVPATARSFADVVAGRPRDEGVLSTSSGPLVGPGPHSSFNGPPVFQDRPGPLVQPQQVAFITPDCPAVWWRGGHPAQRLGRVLSRCPYILGTCEPNRTLDSWLVHIPAAGKAAGYRYRAYLCLPSHRGEEFEAGAALLPSKQLLEERVQCRAALASPRNS
ncbi:hypothetical protein HPB52_023724 [Rhipicephalus sanguineus]|uniref:Reverse transcriptase domain-containing protein n=1 Tax=Rhipicephalus sanguineus TaxID=34632 RepID=A0A9D4Q671_RHISA|nr:hypothetical protein HPB52_023724 [Rhipicephalus sanguineus]